MPESTRMEGARSSAPLGDPVRLEILWQRLLSITDEAAWTLIRTSFSTAVREAWDFGVMVFDTKARNVAQNTSVASKFSLWHTVVPETIRLYPPQTMNPGDAFITNDPWLSDGHLYDHSVVMPIFAFGQLAGYVEITEHLSDIGGTISAIPRDLVEEGLLIPPLRIADRGAENDELLRFIAANLRTPAQNIGDIRGMIAAAGVCARKVVEFLSQNGLRTLDALAEEIGARSERATREAIRRTIPPGTYEGIRVGDGYHGPLRVQVQVQVSDGDVRLDFRGTSEQTDVGTNSPYNHNYAWAAFAIHAIANIDLPANYGSFLPIHMEAPEGSILNPKRGAPVRMRALSCILIPDAIFDALSNAIPERVVAQTGSPPWIERLFGIDEGGRRFAEMMIVQGGMGARARKDGISCVSFPNNASNTPVEVLEQTLPLIYEERSIRAGSAGAGRHRGGFGLREVFRVLHDVDAVLQNSHLQTSPLGLKGGLPGARGIARINDEPVAGLSHRRLRAGDRVALSLPGGGGMYPPEERAAEAVAADVRNGLLTIAEASESYRVVIDPSAFTVDPAATSTLRGRATVRE